MMATGTASAQEWNATAEAGRIRSALDQSAAATSSVALGLRYDDESTGLRLNAGVPMDSETPFWGGAGIWKRLTAGHRGFVAGVDVSGNLYASGNSRGAAPRRVPGPLQPPAAEEPDISGRAGAVQITPLIGYEGTHAEVHARAGSSWYGSSFGDVSTSRLVNVADLQVTYAATPAVAVIPVIRHYMPQDGGEAPLIDNPQYLQPSTYAGVTVLAASARGSVWAMAGKWAQETGGTPWGAGVRVRPHRRFSIDAGIRRETFDPLYFQPAQTSWNVGASLLVGGGAAYAGPPVPAAYANGNATIELPVSAAAATPSIAGDFTKWKPAPMQRRGNKWVYTVPLAPGVYNYSFVSAAGEWFVPESVPGRRDDGMGGHVAVLVVR